MRSGNESNMTYAVIRTGGKQYRVSPGDVFHVEMVEGDVGGEVEFTEVLAAANEGSVQIGHPLVEGAKVTCKVLRQGKAKKILVYKKKRRKNYRRRYGHRQPLTTVQVTAIAV